jgi:hypothetical protein
MNTDTAIALISQLVYKPGWEFIAEDNTSRFEGSVRLTVWYPCHNSDRKYAPAGYPATEPQDTVSGKGEPVAAGTPTIRPEGKAKAAFALMLSDVDDVTELYHLIACTIMQIEEHEMREFLRTAPTYWAPFHPHHDDGIRRWAAVTGQPFRHVQASDLSFGLA